IKQLGLFPEVVERAADARAPHMIAEFLEATAGMVNSWYHAGNPSRNPELAVLVPDEPLRSARLVLTRAVQIVLRNGLELLGLSAPERMEREEAPRACSWWVASPWTASKRPSAERTRRLVVRRSTSVPRPRCSRPCSSSAWSAATTRSTRSTSWSSAAST